jgi:hypothetical protein
LNSSDNLEFFNFNDIVININISEMNDYQSLDSFELLAILLVSHGSSGSHLLFKYPFTDNIKVNNNTAVKTCNLTKHLINMLKLFN